MSVQLKYLEITCMCNKLHQHSGEGKSSETMVSNHKAYLLSTLHTPRTLLHDVLETAELKLRYYEMHIDDFPHRNHKEKAMKNAFLS